MLALTPALPVYADQAEVMGRDPEGRPIVRVVRLTAPLAVDGTLDEAV